MGESLGRALARRAGDPRSNPGPGENFLSLNYKQKGLKACPY